MLSDLPGRFSVPSPLLRLGDPFPLSAVLVSSVGVLPKAGFLFPPRFLVLRRNPYFWGLRGRVRLFGAASVVRRLWSLRSGKAPSQPSQSVTLETGCSYLQRCLRRQESQGRHCNHRTRSSFFSSKVSQNQGTGSTTGLSDGFLTVSLICLGHTNTVGEN